MVFERERDSDLSPDSSALCCVTLEKSLKVSEPQISALVQVL